MKRNKFVLAIVTATVVSLAACNNATEPASQEMVETPVAVAEAFNGNLSGSNQLTGVAKASSDIQVVPKANGQLIEVLVERNQIVERGQVLARIDNGDQLLALEGDKASLRQAQNGLERARNGEKQAKNNVEQAKASLRQAESSMAEARQGREHQLKNISLEIANAERQVEDAKRNVERLQEMYDAQEIPLLQLEEAQAAERRASNVLEQIKLSQTQASSEQNLQTLQATVDQAKVNVRVAEANVQDAEIAVKDAELVVEQMKLAVEMAEKRVDQTVLRAPVTGQIAQLDAEVGEFVSTQSPFARLISVDTLEVEASIAAGQLMLFELGDEVEVLFAGATNSVVGKVSYIASSADTSGLFAMEVSVSNQDGSFRPGMVATLKVEQVLVENSVIVPTPAIMERQGISYIFAVENGIAVRKDIDVVRYDTEYTAITGGVIEGEQIVVKGQNLLADGDAIRIVREGN